MPAQPLSKEQKEDAHRLQSAWLTFKADHPGSNQEKLAFECGWKTQGSVSQYTLGKIPLNLPALLKFSKALGVPASDISPTLASQLPEDEGQPDIAKKYQQSSDVVKGVVDDLMNMPAADAAKLAGIVASIRATYGNKG